MNRPFQSSALAGLAVLVSLASVAPAALVATDNANDGAYNDGWQSGDNGGAGWGGGWSLSVTNGDNPNGNNGGFFVYTATANAQGPATGGGIDVNSESWGLYANSGRVSNAVRPFDGTLSIGQTFSLGMDNGWIDDNASVGFGLQTSTGDNRFEFFFKGGQSNYQYIDSAGTNNTTLGYTADGLTISLTLLTADTYSATFTRLAGGTQTVTGTLGGTAGTGVAQVRLFNATAGSFSERNAYFNSIAVPEPTSLAFVGVFGAALLARRRRQAV